MNFDNLFSSTNISASGLSAERFRMEVVANNIANASSTRTADGGPYRRQEVVFAAMLDETLSSQGGGRRGSPGIRGAPRLASSGVQVVGLEQDASALHRIHDPGHPDAEADGYVTMPNVDLPVEMVNLITASRAYEANLRAMQTFRQMAEQSLSILKA
jgi:flagellar basal-body rod protein FlgC